MMLQPSNIYFSQDSINSVFNERCMHCYTSVGQTLDDLCEGRISVDDIPRISVKLKNGKWFTGDNRRLWVFRHLERLGKCTTIPVNQASYIPDNKFTTFNGGASVTVRRNPGGRWYLKPSQGSVKTHAPRVERRSPSPIQFLANYRRSEPQPRSTFDNFGSFNTTNSNLTHSPINYVPASSALRPTPESVFKIGGSASLFNRNTYSSSNTAVQDLQRSLSSMTIPDTTDVKYVDPLDCRFLKDQIKTNFDDGRSCDSLKRSLIHSPTSYRKINAVKVYEAYDVYYVQDGNRRLKAFTEARTVMTDIKIKVEVIGDEDELLDELRQEDPAITAFEVMQLGETVVVN